MNIDTLTNIIMKQVLDIIEEEKGDKDEYQKFFRKTLKKYGVDEPDKLSDSEKKKFFDEIDKGWKSDAEEDGVEEETGDKEAYQKFFQKTLKKYGVNQPDKLSDADKKKFFNEIDKGWKSDAEEDGVEEGNGSGFKKVEKIGAGDFLKNANKQLRKMYDSDDSDDVILFYNEKNGKPNHIGTFNIVDSTFSSDVGLDKLLKGVVEEAVKNGDFDEAAKNIAFEIFELEDRKQEFIDAMKALDVSIANKKKAKDVMAKLDKEASELASLEFNGGSNIGDFDITTNVEDGQELIKILKKLDVDAKFSKDHDPAHGDFIQFYF
jgi:hypothetical protein